MDTSPPAPRRRAAPATGPRLCVLGSGSGGNCTVLHPRVDDPAFLLLDAGFGPRTTTERLRQAGLCLTDCAGLVLTHLDRDHFRTSWVSTVLRTGVPVFCHQWHAQELALHPRLRVLDDTGMVMPFSAVPFEPLPGVRIQALMMQHDRQGTAAFRIECSTVQPLRGTSGVAPARRVAIGYATDLGHAPPALIQHFAGVDLLCIESNYDHHMTKTSARPSFVNRRNLSDSGHLSNDQALDACVAIDAASPHQNPRRIVLLHGSTQCNHPTKIRRCFEAQPRIARRVTLTHQRRRTRWISVPPLPAMKSGQMRLTPQPTSA